MWTVQCACAKGLICYMLILCNEWTRRAKVCCFTQICNMCKRRQETCTLVPRITRRRVTQSEAVHQRMQNSHCCFAKTASYSQPDKICISTPISRRFSSKFIFLEYIWTIVQYWFTFPERYILNFFSVSQFRSVQNFLNISTYVSLFGILFMHDHLLGDFNWIFYNNILIFVPNYSM